MSGILLNYLSISFEINSLNYLLLRVLLLISVPKYSLLFYSSSMTSIIHHCNHHHWILLSCHGLHVYITACHQHAVISMLCNSLFSDRLTQYWFLISYLPWYLYLAQIVRIRTGLLFKVSGFSEQFCQDFILSQCFYELLLEHFSFKIPSTWFFYNFGVRFSEKF